MREPDNRIRQIQFPTPFYLLIFTGGETGGGIFSDMKKILIILGVLFVCLTSVLGQELLEVLYLKDGSIIRGVIIEQIPDKSIKIQTNEGNIFAYPMQNVLKITKEYPNLDNKWSHRKKFSFKKQFAAKPGYAGFVEIGGGIGISPSGGFVNLTTSHGYQIIPQLFTGIGAGAHFDIGNTLISLPVFADIRYNILNSNITPFIGVKVGYSLLDVQGVYFSPSLGCRFGLSENAAINLSFSYQLQSAKTDWYYYRFKLHYFALKLGVEF